MVTIDERFALTPLNSPQIESIQAFEGISSLAIQQQISIGRSGASVYFVDIEPKTTGGPQGPHVLKIDKRSRAVDELSKHENARRTKIGHLIPALVATGSSRDKSISAALYELAQGTLVNAFPLSHLIRTNISRAKDQVAATMVSLATWNTEVKVNYAKPFELLQHVLGERLTGTNSIVAVAAEEFGLAVSDVLIRLHGDSQVLPNPIAYAVRSDLWGQGRAPAWPAANTHGDLHSNNIICSMTFRSNTAPSLIDFSRFDGAGLIFLDYVFLEFPILLDTLPPLTDASREQWLVIDRALSQKIQIRSLPGGATSSAIRDLVAPLRNSVTELVIKFKRPDDFTGMFWLASFAAGLNFFGNLRTRLSVMRRSSIPPIGLRRC
jgi:hypothetical protein